MITISVDDQPAVTGFMKDMLTRIDPCGTHITARNMNEAFSLITDDVQVAFLDIEMPGMGGIEAAELLMERYGRLNIVFVTGHPEYAYRAHDVFPSAFLTKPVNESDIRRALAHLRIPPEMPVERFTVKCSPFSVRIDGNLLDFSHRRTDELFACLVYREGGFCTNSELIRVLWNGAEDKQTSLRQLVMYMRAELRSVGAESLLIKKYGKTAVDFRELRIVGELSDIPKYFGWEK